MDYIMHQQSTDGITCKGKYEMQFYCIDSLGHGDMTMKWLGTRKNKIGINIHNSCKLAIRSFAREHDWTGTFEIEGFTSLTMLVGEKNRSVTYHSTEYI